MIIPSIHNENPVKNPAESAAPKISTTESVKNKDIESEFLDSEARSKAKFKEVIETSNEKMHRIAELMDNYVRSIQSNLKIQVHDKTGTIMVEVISEDTGKVIREIPSKEMLDLAAKMEEMAGAFFDQVV